MRASPEIKGLLRISQVLGVPGRISGCYSRRGHRTDISHGMNTFVAAALLTLVLTRSSSRFRQIRSAISARQIRAPRSSSYSIASFVGYQPFEQLLAPYARSITCRNGCLSRFSILRRCAPSRQSAPRHGYPSKRQKNNKNSKHNTEVSKKPTKSFFSIFCNTCSVDKRGYCCYPQSI